jgi:F5/8 type C domain/PEP-CTERM motif
MTKHALTLLAGLLAAHLAMADTNVAPLGVASQSSVSFSGIASRANDGNTNGAFWGNSVSHSDFEAQPWWQVVLAEPVAVDRVVVWNRTDCCADRLSNYTVSLWLGGSQVSSTFFAGQSPVTQTFSFGSQMADTVRVQLTGTSYLNLAEVQVFASAVPEPTSALLLAAGLGVVALRRRRSAPLP